MRPIHLCVQKILPLTSIVSAINPELQRTVTLQFFPAIQIDCSEVVLLVTSPRSRSRDGEGVKEELNDRWDIEFQIRSRSLAIFVETTQRVFSSRDTIVGKHLRWRDEKKRCLENEIT